MVFCKCQTDSTIGTEGKDTSLAISSNINLFKTNPNLLDLVETTSGVDVSHLVETTNGVDVSHSVSTAASTYEQTFNSSTDSETSLPNTSTTTQSI